MGRRLRKPNYRIAQQQRIHDRRAVSLPINAQVVVDTVDDAYGEPEAASYDPQRREWVSSGPPKVTVVRSLRGDPLAALRAQRIINEAQFLAGRLWSHAHMKSEIGSVRSLDLSQTRVDGGRAPELLNETVKKAIADLKRARFALGEYGQGLVVDILGRGLTLSRAADARGLSSKSGREFIGRRFREALDTLSIVFGCATEARALMLEHA